MILKKATILIIAISFLAGFGMCRRAACAENATLTNAGIESSLKAYEEPGYKFLEKIDEGMWKALYSRPGWKFGWEVVVASTSEKPGESFVVIGTTVLTAEKLPPALMMQLLTENSLDTNPGNYAVFFENDAYFIQYAVKIPQSLLTSDVLMEGIGFVAGYANSRLKELEKHLPPASSAPDKQ